MPFGHGRGFGFRGSSPAWPYIGLERGGLPRCGSPGFRKTPAYNPAVSSFIPEEERESLKNEATAMQSELNRIEARIRELEVNE